MHLCYFIAHIVVYFTAHAYVGGTASSCSSKSRVRPPEMSDEAWEKEKDRTALLTADHNVWCHNAGAKKMVVETVAVVHALSASACGS